MVVGSRQDIGHGCGFATRPSQHQACGHGSIDRNRISAGGERRVKGTRGGRCIWQCCCEHTAQYPMTAHAPNGTTAPPPHSPTSACLSVCLSVCLCLYVAPMTASTSLAHRAWCARRSEGGTRVGALWRYASTLQIRAPAIRCVSKERERE